MFSLKSMSDLVLSEDLVNLYAISILEIIHHSESKVSEGGTEEGIIYN
jgi:hypothetical protein